MYDWTSGTEAVVYTLRRTADAWLDTNACDTVEISRKTELNGGTGGALEARTSTVARGASETETGHREKRI